MIKPTYVKTGDNKISTLDEHIDRASKYIEKVHQNLQAAQTFGLDYDQIQQIETFIDKTKDLIYSIDQ